MGATLVGLAIQELPATIAALKALFVEQNPGVPPPTDAEVFAAYTQAFVSSITKDENWLSSHPVTQP